MAPVNEKTRKLSLAAVASHDIFFECPSCGKSLVVDEAAAGMILDCPQCRIGLIVPPKETSQIPGAQARPASSSAAASALETKPSAELARVGHSELAALQEQLVALGHRLKELQTQRTEINNRLVSHVNEINRDLVAIARLETAHQQIMNEWRQIVSQIEACSPQTIVLGASARVERPQAQAAG